MMLSFDNTERAFAHKSDMDLVKAYRLFQTFSYPFLVNQGPKLANCALSLRLPIKGLIKRTIFHQFCGGESIEESAASAKELYENGIGAILDYSVEGEGSADDFENTYNELMRVVDESAQKPEYPFIVFKCTGIGSFSSLQKVSSKEPLTENEAIKFDIFRQRENALCESTLANKSMILIDAEETWIQDAIDECAYENMAIFNRDEAVVYNTIQLYRKGRIEEITKQIEIARSKGYKLGFKLVRGAYMEKEAARAIELGYENPIQDSKEDSDKDYNDALKLCFDNRDVVSIMAGTHNEDSSYVLANLLEENNIPKNDSRFWFAQLYGMSDHISFNLAQAGFNVAKYLPYGPVKEVLPYLSRRARENSSVKGQAGRELSLIMSEIKRRKQK